MSTTVSQGFIILHMRALLSVEGSLLGTGVYQNVSSNFNLHENILNLMQYMIGCVAASCRIHNVTSFCTVPVSYREKYYFLL